MLMEILLGILGLIGAAILLVTFKNRKQISALLNATLAARKLQKDLEKDAYNEAYKKMIPEFMEAKAAQDMERKLNKKPLAEKLSEMSKELTKDTKSGKASGLNSIMDDVNVFKNSDNKKKEDNWVTRPIKDADNNIIGKSKFNKDFFGDAESPFFKQLDKLKKHKKDDDPFDFIGLPKDKSLKGLGLGDDKKRKKDDKWFTELI
jgi:superfamily I DNA/RNA helicase